MLRKKYLLIISILIVSLIITIISCGRKGTLHPNTVPFIEITQYSGVTKPDTLTDQEMFEEIGNLIDPEIYDSIFCQTIYWSAWDIDGSIKAYAYRIGTWDSTANIWEYDKAYCITVNEDGWVLHEQPNGEFDIWTPPDERYAKAKVYFPSTDTTDFKKNFGKFEVKCKDDRNDESEVSIKYFITYSEVPLTRALTSQGNIDSCRVGTAILFEFLVEDEDPYQYGKYAAYYKYRLVYYEKTTADSMIVEWDENVALDSTKWYSTEEYDEYDKVLLMETEQDTAKRPQLRVNALNEVTQIQVRAVDKAGIEDPDYASMSFFVRGHFTPETRPFMSSWELNEDPSMDILPHIYVLGEYFWLPYAPADEVLPQKEVMGEDHYGNKFYMDKNGILSAFWSDDIEVYMKWEYYGEYIYDSRTSSKRLAEYTFYYDSTYAYQQYYCDVEYMEIQLDGGTEGLPPIGTKVTDEITGEEWMRIPIYKDQNCKLFNRAGNFLSGTHTFKVRAIDLQGRTDPTPETLEFYLGERVDAGNKSGVLLVDDTGNQNIFAIEDSVNNFYSRLLENCSDSIAILDLHSDPPLDSTGTPIYTRNKQLRQDDLAPYFAPSDIQEYKLIIWHSNNPVKFYDDITQTHMIHHYDLLTYYLDTGGNLLFTGCARIYDPNTAKTNFLQNYAGFADSLSALSNSLEDNNWLWGTPNPTNSMFTGANSFGNFSEIDTLHLNPHIYKLGLNFFPEYWLTTPLGAIGNITFLELGEAETIFTCIADTLGEHQIYNGACVGSKYMKEQGVTGTVYVLGFPLYYIQLDDAKLFIHKVFDEAGVSHSQ